MISDATGLAGPGNMVTGLQDWNVGKGIIPLQLSMPGQPVNVMSGYNSRGNNTQFSVSLQGQVCPAANADSQVTAQISTLVVVETTAQLRVNGMKNVSISF